MVNPERTSILLAIVSWSPHPHGIKPGPAFPWKSNDVANFTSIQTRPHNIYYLWAKKSRDCPQVNRVIFLLSYPPLTWSDNNRNNRSEALLYKKNYLSQVLSIETNNLRIIMCYVSTPVMVPIVEYDTYNIPRVIESAEDSHKITKVPLRAREVRKIIYKYHLNIFKH